MQFEDLRIPMEYPTTLNPLRQILTFQAEGNWSLTLRQPEAAKALKPRPPLPPGEHQNHRLASIELP